jgi:hypothetical protein
MTYIIQGPNYEVCFKAIESYAKRLKACLENEIIDDPMDIAFHIGSCFNIACAIVRGSTEQLAQTHRRYQEALEQLNSVMPILLNEPGLLRYLQLGAKS